MTYAPFKNGLLLSWSGRWHIPKNTTVRRDGLTGDAETLCGIWAYSSKQELPIEQRVAAESPYTAHCKVCLRIAARNQDREAQQ